jgi:hypothetical protein
VYALVYVLLILSVGLIVARKVIQKKLDKLRGVRS